MRRLLPWFLMLLLALRGLTGVAMAAEAAPEASKCVQKVSLAEGTKYFAVSDVNQITMKNLLE